MSRPSLSPNELSDLIGLAYDAAFDDPPWQSLLDRLIQLFPGVGANVYAYHNDMVLPEYSASGVSEFFSEPAALDLMELGLRVPGDLNLGRPNTMFIAEALQHMANGFVARTKLFFDENIWMQTPIYTKVLKPAGYKHTLQMKIEHVGSRGAMIGFAIPAEPELEARIHDPLFDLLKLLSPHMQRASQLARAIALAKRASEVFGGFLDGIILPMLVTDAAGKFLFGNAAGRRMLERGTPFSISADGRLKLPEPFETDALYLRLRQADHNLVQSGMRLEMDAAPLSLAITPFRPSLREAGAIDRYLLNEERLLAIFVGQSSSDAVSAPLLEDVFDLTAREAEVCKQLMLSNSVAQIAKLADRSPKTVRNQIQIIYEKVGVSSNIDLLEALSVFRTVGTLFDDDGPNKPVPKAPVLAGGNTETDPKMT